MKRSIVNLMLGMMAIGLITAGCRASLKTESAPLADTAEHIARAYGIDQFEKIDAVRYTFNVKIKSRQIRRAWVWEPDSDRITYSGQKKGGEKISRTYLRSRINAGAPEDLVGIDRRFINDQYWLLFPFHLKWDSDIRLTFETQQPLPIPPGKADRLVVQYPPGVGYTPGDAYDLYLDPDYRIKQWVYRKAGAPTPTRAATWENHARVGPLVLSLDRQGPDGDFRVWFTDVAVKLKNSDEWIESAALE
jgi:hypothetical protein